MCYAVKDRLTSMATLFIQAGGAAHNGRQVGARLSASRKWRQAGAARQRRWACLANHRATGGWARGETDHGVVVQVESGQHMEGKATIWAG
jgi:hypothetical protein